MQGWHLNGSCNTDYGLDTASSHCRLADQRKGRVFNLVQLPLPGYSPLLCQSQCLPTETCPVQWRLLSGSLAHSGSSLGSRDHTHISEAHHQEQLCSSLSLGRAECALLCNLWGLFLYCMQNRNGTLQRHFGTNSTNESASFSITERLSYLFLKVTN